MNVLALEIHGQRSMTAMFALLWRSPTQRRERPETGSAGPIYFMGFSSIALVGPPANAAHLDAWTNFAPLWNFQVRWRVSCQTAE